MRSSSAISSDSFTRLSGWAGMEMSSARRSGLTDMVLARKRPSLLAGRIGNTTFAAMLGRCRKGPTPQKRGCCPADHTLTAARRAEKKAPAERGLGAFKHRAVHRTCMRAGRAAGEVCGSRVCPCLLEPPSRRTALRPWAASGRTVATRPHASIRTFPPHTARGHGGSRFGDLQRCASTHSAGSLRNHQGGRVGVAAGDGGHHAGVDNPQAADAQHAKPRIDHGQRVVAAPHAAGAHRVEDGGADVACQPRQLVLALELRCRA